MIINCLSIGIVFCLLRLPLQPVNLTTPDTLHVHISEVSGIGFEQGIVRRDPSDVIRVGEQWYVWYTRVVQKEAPAHLATSGYAGTIWYAVSEDEGRNWREMGPALGPGPTGRFDSYGVFTPNILFYRGRFYLYYTGVRPTPGKADSVFENNSTNDFTALGVAVARQPNGPFIRAERPVLTTGFVGRPEEGQPSAFDSYRVDDAALLVRDNQIWLYYKGRNIDDGPQGPRHTRMGLAVADQPMGPFVRRHGGQAVQPEGHEVLIWCSAGNVFSLVTAAGRGLYRAEDGVHFRKLPTVLAGQVHAPGAARDELVDHKKCSTPSWGISMRHGASPCLVRWEIKQLE